MWQDNKYTAHGYNIQTSGSKSSEVENKFERFTMAGKLVAKSHTTEKLSLKILAVKTILKISVSKKSVAKKKTYGKNSMGKNTDTKNSFSLKFDAWKKRQAHRGWNPGIRKYDGKNCFYNSDYKKSDSKNLIKNSLIPQSSNP